MKVKGINAEFEEAVIGKEIHALIEKLYPICRSISGDGVRQSLTLLQQHIPLTIHEVPTGTQVFDWVVPKEWNIKDAYIKDAKGQRVVDFQANNLHIVSYSMPINTKMTLAELRPHLHSLPDDPDWIPYRTSYYNETWGFCLSHNQLQQLTEQIYEVVIDSSLVEGSLSYGEYYLPGKTEEEVLIFSHICHPSLCNDNLSGVALSTHLAAYLSEQSLRYSYRFIYTPATIGSITWLSQNEPKLANIKHGLVAAVLGDAGKMHYKLSRRGDAEIDRVVKHVLAYSGDDYEILEFIPYGYDERQFCSPGINLPMGRLTRTPNGCYPEYHTSADNLELVRADSLADTFKKYVKVLSVLEHNLKYLNTSPKCEPQLGKRGLYRKTGGHKDIGQREFALLWVLNLADGNHSLLDIADRAKIEFGEINAAARDLHECGLLQLMDHA